MREVGGSSPRAKSRCPSVEGRFADGAFSKRNCHPGHSRGHSRVRPTTIGTEVVHKTFLQRIPELMDLQCAWLLFLFCGVVWANFFLRTISTISPALSHSFATRHDAQIWRCFSTLVGLSTDTICYSAKITASLPLAVGGLGLRSATKLRFAAQWASWADTIKMVNERHPEVGERIIQAIRDRDGP